MGPKKKLSKKEKARLEAEQMELARIEMEKEKQRKLEEERQRMEKEREEAEKRKQQEIIENQIRRKQLKMSISYFDEIQKKINQIRNEEKKKKEWEKYMRCNGAPNTENPGDLREYLYTWNLEMEHNSIVERNWLLKTNERTLLTQDPDMPNLSREYLRKQQPNLGDIYSKRIKDVLEILTELDETLEDENISESVIRDLLSLKFEFRSNLKDFLNDFTHKILSHIERDMESDKPGVVKHVYESCVFKSQILTILGETQMNQKDKIKDLRRHVEMNFEKLEIQLSLPPSVKLQNSALRGLWLNYDHFSDLCFSYRLPKLKQKHLDILQQTKKEWKKRKEILQSALDNTTMQTPIEGAYNEEIDENQQQKSQKTVDVDKIYTEYEDEINKIRRNEMQLDLLETDINLRRYRIVSGVYCIDYIEQPQQDKKLNAFSFIRTIYYPNTLKYKKFYHVYRPPPPTAPGVRRLPEEIEAEIKMIEQNLDKLAMLTIQLPDTVLWFEPPLVCRWEVPEETIESEISDAELNKKKLVTNGGSEQVNTKNDEKKNEDDIESVSVRTDEDKTTNNCKHNFSFSSTVKNLPVKEIEDFDLKNIPDEVDLFSLVIEFIIPRIPYGYCIQVNHYDEEKQENSIQYLSIKCTSTEEDQSSIKELLERTNSPRPLFPQLNFRRILRIKGASGYGHESQIMCKQSLNKTDLQQVSESKMMLDQETSYMFSQLVEDLDKLYEREIPFLNDRIDEISSRMVSVQEDDDNDAKFSPPRRFSGVIIIRECDIPKDHITNRLNRNLAENKFDYDEEESSSEYDDENCKNFAEEREKLLIDGKHGKWNTRDIHDSKFNEDKLCMQFRVGRLGYFGFATNRYSNMPYQTWEIKPDLKNPGIILFSLTAAIISLEMQIFANGVCITNFQGAALDPLTDIIGHTMPLNQLRKKLATRSVDIFPENDAFCYTEGSCEKNYVMEMHLYKCMSNISQSHNFSWSRWNLLSGSRTAVLLMRELIEGRKAPNHSTLYVTPLKVSVVDCTEVSPSFSTTGVPGMEYYADLHHLAEAHAHSTSIEKRNKINPMLMNNVDNILKSVRPLSFC